MIHSHSLTKFSINWVPLNIFRPWVTKRFGFKIGGVENMKRSYLVVTCLTIHIHPVPALYHAYLVPLGLQ